MQAAQDHVDNQHIGTHNHGQDAHDAHSDHRGHTWEEFAGAVDSQ